LPAGAFVPAASEWAAPIAAAAVREVFEEVGILLARKQGRFARDADSEHIRAQIAGGHTFGAALGALGLDPANDRLVPFARWVTPAQLRRRLQATFFPSPPPPGQSGRPHARR